MIYFVIFFSLIAHHCNVVDGFVRNKKLLSKPSLRWIMKKSPVMHNVPICTVESCQGRENPCSESPVVSSVKAVSCSQAHSNDGQQILESIEALAYIFLFDQPSNTLKET